MKKEKNKDKRVIYYNDELNNDFGTIEIESIEVPDDHKYIRKGPFKVLSSVIYWGLASWILAIVSYFMGVRVKNKKNLKHYYELCKLNDCAGFIYANHVSNVDPFYIQTTVIRKRRVNIIGAPNILSNKFISWISRILGYIPLPNHKKYKEYNECLRYYVKDKKQDIIIYPEAHVWPYYTKIRPFVSGSFHYPVKFKTPILPIVTTFQKGTFKWSKPKKVVYILKPNIPLKYKTDSENREYLRDYCFNVMKEASESVVQEEYIKYIKVDDPSKVSHQNTNLTKDKSI